MTGQNLIGKSCFIKRRDGTEIFAGIAEEIVERGRTLVKFSGLKLLWPIEQTITAEEARLNAVYRSVEKRRSAALPCDPSGNDFATN